MVFLFTISFFLLIYTFVGYPLLLKLLTSRSTKTIQQNSELPELSLVLCVHNGADLLVQRIKNIMENGYPKEKIHLIVVSDGSTDDPESVINFLALDNVELIHYKENKGKSFALNEGLKSVKTDLVAFADIRQKYAKGTLAHLAASFLNEKVGAASGNLHIISDELNGESESGLYWKYEKWIREKESELYSLLGVTGAVYMARTALIPDVPKGTLLDDMFIPLSIVKKGFQIKFVAEAEALDSSSATLEEEFHRKVRTLAGNFQLLSLLPWLLIPFVNPVLFQFFSHKVMRLIMPYALITLLFSSILGNNWILNYAAACQLLFYGYSFVCYRLLKKNIKLPFSSIFVSFCSLNLAALVAGWKYYFGSREQLWKKH